MTPSYRNRRDRAGVVHLIIQNIGVSFYPWCGAHYLLSSAVAEPSEVRLMGDETDEAATCLRCIGSWEES